MEDNNKTIEERFDELNTLLEQMDNDTLPLEESFKLYNKGLEIVKDCNERIEKVEKELEILDKEVDE